MNGKIASLGVQACVQGMQYSMWKNHSFDLGEKNDPLVRSIDIGLFKGKYYCSVSPGFAFLSLPFAATGFIMDGGDFKLIGYSMIMGELSLAIFASLASMFVYKICRLFAQRTTSLLASITFAFATTVWPMSAIIYINNASVPFSIAAVYLVMRLSMRREDKGTGHPVMAGLSLGLASFVEYMTIVFVPILATYLFFKTGSKRNLLFFLLASSVGPGMHFIYNYSVFEDPFMFPEKVKPAHTSLGKQMKVESWNQEQRPGFRLEGLGLHALAYLISPLRGLILFSPILILGMYQLYRMVRSNRYRSDAILFISLFLAILLPYSAWHDWVGGPGYGPRFLISTVPYFVIPIAILLSENRSTILRGVFLPLFCISSFIQGVGALTNAWSLGRHSLLVYQPYDFNIPWLLEGKLNVWWLTTFGIKHIEVTQSFIQLFATVVFLSLWAIAAYFTIKNIHESKTTSSLAEVDD
ncbi:MAG: glycosyltransferase family 39 protein [Nitrososphaerales archaeon]